MTNTNHYTSPSQNAPPTIERLDPLKHVMPGPPLAIAAGALFLINLMLLPGFAFIALVVLWRKYRNHADPLVRNHLQQNVVASLWGGAVLLSVSLLIMLLGGFSNPWTWLVGILYFVLFHAGLIYLGVMGMIRAMNGHTWRFPWIGPALP